MAEVKRSIAIPILIASLFTMDFVFLILVYLDKIERVWYEWMI